MTAAIADRLRVVLVTHNCLEKGKELARILLREHLVACVNIVPGVTSLYTFEGRSCEDSEILLILKTADSRLPSLEQRIRELHPYKVPEFLILQLRGVSEDYGNWVLQTFAGRE